MLNAQNVNEDLKVLFLCSGFVTQDEDCGYDEIIFAVRKSYLFEAVKDDQIKTCEDLDEWLRELYTSDEIYDFYQKAKKDKEIVFEQPVWNTRRVVYYEVIEEWQDGCDRNERVHIRTFDYETAKKVFQIIRDELREGGSFISDGNLSEFEEAFDYGHANMRIEDEYGDYDELTLHKIEVETEKRKTFVRT